MNINMSASMDSFEDIIRDTGGFGWFQKRFLFIVLNLYYITLPFSWLNEIFVLKTPDHWCWHPSSVGLNDSELAVWKACFLPNMEDESGGFESCEIYKPSDMDAEDFWYSSQPYNPGECPIKMNNRERVPCARENQFDTTGFIRTIPSDYNWVCDKKGYVPLAFLAGVVGSIVGTSFYNYLGDVIGRKSMTGISILNAIVFSILKSLSAKYLYVYMLFKALASAAYSSSYQLPFAIIMEISTPKTRSYGIASTSIAWTIGVCLLPLYAWALHGDWFILSITSPIPLVFFYLAWKWIPESPRWLLIKKGNVQYAKEILQNMASTNKAPKCDDEVFEKRLKIFAENNKEEIRSLITEYKNLIFTSGLRIKTLCLTLASIANFYIYYQIMINVQFNEVNTFLMFFLLSIVEGPGYLLGQFFLEVFGRRWTHVGFQVTNVLAMVSIIAVQNSDLDNQNIIISVLCIITKLNSCAGYIVFEVQSTEIYPTNMRTTGIGFTCLIALIVGLSGPHVVYLGGSAPYIVMGSLCFVASIACAFIPETKGIALPENMKQASKFGQESKNSP